MLTTLDIRTFAVLIMSTGPRFSLILCLWLAPVVTAAVDYPDRYLLLNQLRGENFISVSNTIRSYQEAFEAGTGDERLVQFAVESLAWATPETERLLDKWIKIRPLDYAAYLVRGHYYYEVAWAWRGHGTEQPKSAKRRKLMQTYLEKAADDLTRVLELNGNVTVAYALALRILMVLGSDDVREEALAEAMQAFPTSYVIRSCYLWGLKPKWGGRSRDLLAYLKETEKLVDKNPLLGNLLGYSDYIFAESLSDSKDYEEASEHFDFAVMKGADHHIHLDRGINFFKRGMYEQAMSDFEQSLVLWPQNPRVLRWQAHVLIRTNQWPLAEAALVQALALTPYDKSLLMSLAYVRRKTGNFENVVDIYNTALYYNANDPRVWFERGMHYKRDLFNFPQATRDIKRATELAPTVSRYWYQYTASLHYNNDCSITGPLNKYLTLCASQADCNQKELAWARDARQWLQDSGTCPN